MTKKRKNTNKENSQPVYFMDLVVENVRCFKDRQVLDLSNGDGKPARWTVILGDNGTGKTTLLRCLAYLEATGFATIPNLKLNKISYIPFGFNSNFSSFYGDWIEARRLSVGLLEEENKIIDGYFISIEESQSRDEDISSLKVYGYGANRMAGKGTISDTLNEKISDSLFNENIFLINAEEWLLQTLFKAQNAKAEVRLKLKSKYQQVEETLKKILPDVLDFRIKPITEYNSKAIIQAKTFYGWVDMENLSMGYQTLIAWTVDLAARLFERYPDSETPLAEPAIVLVDEIDLHLHPKWQRNLISHLTNIFSQTQFIVTAHSPLIVQSAKDANIVLLKREGDRVKIYNNKDEDIIKGWRVDQVLTSDLFGLESTWSPEYDKFIERKQEILKKKRLTPKDKKELEEIGKKLEELDIATGEKSNDALEALQKAAAVLKSNR